LAAVGAVADSTAAAAVVVLTAVVAAITNRHSKMSPLQNIPNSPRRKDANH
jgi:hypothetical protein